MRIASSKSAQRAENVNLPVRVEGFVQKDNAFGVKGIDLRNNKPVTVFLSTEGKAAENAQRKSIQSLKDGFKIGRNTFTLEPGGIVSFKGAFSGRDGDYISTWANVLAFNASDAEQYVRQSDAAMLRMYEKKGVHRGTVYIYEADPAAHITGASAEELREGLAGAVESTTPGAKPGFLIRALDKEGNVVGFEQKSKYYHTAQERPMTPSEIAEVIADAAEGLKQTTGAASLNIVPIDQIMVSAESLKADDKGRSQLGAFQGAEKAYVLPQEDGSIELCCKHSYMKLGGDQNQFVNGIYATDPYGPGDDPVLLGGLSYSPAFDSDHEASTGPATEANPEASADEAAEAEYDSAPSPM
jgi:hypothetical protein